jgi:ribosomal protein S18 acetylase RimI-like enzyme
LDVRIVPIAEEHIAGFREALDSVARERRYLWFLEAPSAEDTAAFVRSSVKKGYPHCVALVAGKVVGWCDIVPMERPTLAHCGALGIGVSAEYRGRGIGKALLKAVLESAKAAGLTRIELSVREDNARAIALYEKLGFVVEGLKRNGVRFDGKYFNVVSMALLLEP